MQERSKAWVQGMMRVAWLLERDSRQMVHSGEVGGRCSGFVLVILEKLRDFVELVEDA